MSTLTAEEKLSRWCEFWNRALRGATVEVHYYGQRQMRVHVVKISEDLKQQIEQFMDMTLVEGKGG